MYSISNNFPITPGLRRTFNNPSLSAYRGLYIRQLRLPLTQRLISPFMAEFGALRLPLRSCYKELRGIKYCVSASDALAHSTEQEIPAELAELSVCVGGFWRGPGKVGEGPRAGLCPVPLFPFLADGPSPVTYVSLAGGRGLCQPTRYPLAFPTPLPAKACTCHGPVGGRWHSLPHTHTYTLLPACA